MAKARRVCSWCGKDLGWTDSDQYEEGAVTHGICDDCLKAKEHLKSPKRED